MDSEVIVQLVLLGAAMALIVTYTVRSVLRGRRAANLPTRRRISVEEDRARNLIKQAIGSIRGHVVSENSETIVFQTSLSWLSWRGQEMVVTLVDNGDGSTDVAIEGRARPSFQLYDWNEASLIRKRIFEHIEMKTRLRERG